ncbi:uba3 [Symbiodinium microadriaticum]|nr:uba3 [Symbiodinium microadriaticum]
MKDVNRPKAEVAAEFIMQRVPGCLVTPYYCRIQDFDEDFYRQFKLIVSGLDNIEARRWLNNMLVSMVTFDEDGDIDPDSIVPLLDGGRSINTDSPDDVQWVYHTALRRAEKFGISGVTYFLTLGVVKNVIPAVASTNAVIAASCANEAVKLLSFSAQSLNTYMMYMGSCGLYTDTFAYSKKDDCPVCGTAPPIKVSLSARTTTLQGLIDMLGEHPLCQMKGPFITSEAATLYAFNPPALKEALAPNLEKLMVELVRDDEILNVTDSRLNITVSIHVKFTDIP